MTATDIPRPEYPRPQFVREDWINLNGEWSYTFDFGQSGMDRGRRLFKSKGFEGRIIVPFCPESRCSGVEHTDFIPAMWYHRKITLPASWAGRRMLLHFGGVDYECEAFVDGVSVGTHFGGTVSFCFDVTDFAVPGSTHDLVVRVKDDLRGDAQPRGKQSFRFASQGCSYTRTTGIWQTVWLEAVDPRGLSGVQIVPNLDDATVSVTARYPVVASGMRLNVRVKADGELKGETTVSAVNGVPAVVTIADAVNWSPAHPFLYDVELTVTDRTGTVIDRVESYVGLRKVHVEGNQLYLNNEPLYLRLVLDQGFYPDGIWTAPTDDDLKQDILLSMAAGFNGARLHQKVFEPRFHYWADKLGYVTWGESASWGCDCSSEQSARKFLTEWQEIVVRDRNHPSIIAWTPFNETGGYRNLEQHRRLHVDCYDLCKELDPTRPVNDASGWIHHKTDLWTVHSYKQNPDELQTQLSPGEEGSLFRNYPEEEAAYGGQPYLVDEYGGIKWIPPTDPAFAANSWGYGNAPETLEAFYERLEGLTDVLLALDHVSGYCYTQLTDVEQEQNGIYNYDRSEKFDMARIKRVFNREPEGREA